MNKNKKKKPYAPRLLIQSFAALLSVIVFLGIMPAAQVKAAWSDTSEDDFEQDDFWDDEFNDDEFPEDDPPIEDLPLDDLSPADPSQANSPRQIYFSDSARLVDDSDVDEVNEYLKTTSEALNFGIYLVTLDGIGGGNPERVAGNIYDEYNLGYGENRDGALLLISMEERDWAIIGNGSGAAILDDYGRGYVIENIMDQLHFELYKEAFMSYADFVRILVNNSRKASSDAGSSDTANSGIVSSDTDGFDEDTAYLDPYAPGGVFYNPFDLGAAIFISFIISTVIGLITFFVMKGQLTSVSFRQEASEYVTPGTLKLTNQKDLYLYSTVTKTPKPKSSSSSSSSSGGGSSGGSRSSGSGKF